MLASKSLCSTPSTAESRTPAVGVLAAFHGQIPHPSRKPLNTQQRHARAVLPTRPLVTCQATELATNGASTNGATASKVPLKVVIVGGGIGGLVLAAGLLRKGYEVQVLERDLTAIRGEGKYRGPIQIQSNALAALEALDAPSAERVMEEGCITGDRVNGLCDGLTGDW